jgi:exodeoxyribonuclease V gamma subunit
MSLTVRFISSLREIVDPAIAFLSRERDLFAQPRIVVPSAGAKAWLENLLARRLGAGGRDDGIVAAVEFAYLGAIAAWLQPPRVGATPDPWSLDRLTFAVLDVIRTDTGRTMGIPGDLTREPLLAARRIAGLFDEYHVRRPGMILEWERDQENPVLAPTAQDEQQDGIAVPASLRDGDRWQFRLWREVRRRIGVASPPKRRSVTLQDNHEPILVAGLQSLALPQLESLEALGKVCDIEAYFVHPSPGLRTSWTSRQQPLRADLRDRPLQKPKAAEFPPDVDPLLPVWLAGACELHALLAARGTPVEDASSSAGAAMAAAGDRSLLGRMQQSVLSAKLPTVPAHDPSHDAAQDRSFVIHRCHSLSRQAEVLHDALLQAFDDLDDLQPHEIAVMSPCLEEAAPHLEAVFQRTVTGRGPDGKERRLHLPLVVADRRIRETSPAADLLVALLAIPGSRASIDDVLTVAGHPLVCAAFGINDDTVAAWTDYLERTIVRWGLDADHRRRHGLTIPPHDDVHTWKLGLERMLLGAVMAETVPQADLGDVVPLDGLDPVDLGSITSLVRILDLIRSLDAKTTEHRTAAAWCDAIEEALVGLCGEGCGELAEPLELLGRLRAAAAGTAAEQADVPFEDVRGLLDTWLDDMPGRQPLRSGAITATSMVPLRGVPFRVIAVIGYDEGTVGGGEADGDNLTARQQLVGDVDPRVDARRALLDALLSAGERLLITCNGRSVKSNQKLPLVTPLAELVDFAVAHGVTREKYDELSAIEIDHPRHHLSRRNFTPGGVLTGRGAPEVVWSHDALALEVLRATTRRQAADDGPIQRSRHRAGDDASTGHSQRLSDAAAEPIITELTLIERMVKDPLGLYLEETLGIDIWREDDEATPATLPLVLEQSTARKLTLVLLGALLEDPGCDEAWIAGKQRSGILPLAAFGRRQADEIVALARGLISEADSEQEIDLTKRVVGKCEGVPLGRHRLVGDVPGVFIPESSDTAEPQLVIVTAAESDKDSYGRPLHMATLHLLAAWAAGIEVERATIISRRKEWEVGAFLEPSKRFPNRRPVAPAQTKIVRLDPRLMNREAAREHLDQVAALAHEAARDPRPAFYKVITSEPPKRSDAFEKFIDADFYVRSSECLMFGRSPTFEVVYEAEPERLAFLDAFKRLLEPTYDRQKQAYFLR